MKLNRFWSVAFTLYLAGIRIGSEPTVSAEPSKVKVVIHMSEAEVRDMVLRMIGFPFGVIAEP